MRRASVVLVALFAAGIAVAAVPAAPQAPAIPEVTTVLDAATGAVDTVTGVVDDAGGTVEQAVGGGGDPTPTPTATPAPGDDGHGGPVAGTPAQPGGSAGDAIVTPTRAATPGLTTMPAGATPEAPTAAVRRIRRGRTAASGPGVAPGNRGTELVSWLDAAAGQLTADGAAPAPPPPSAPGFVLAEPGAVALGVPSFMIDRFRIPPFLLAIYQAAGAEYGIRWEVLAAINEIETDYGRNLNVSSAGAVGWMQFMPSTWRRWGIDGNGDGRLDPYNPVDAIFSAARYLRAAGGQQDLRQAIFAYNHADWYVDSVLLRARVIGGLPSGLVGALTGLTQGRFPVQARATYADELVVRGAERRHDWLVRSDGRRHSVHIYSSAGAPVVAVNDGRIVAAGRSARLGHYLRLEDEFGNEYTYGQLRGEVAGEPSTRPDEPPRTLALRAVRDRRLHVGTQVVAGQRLARIARTPAGIAPHLLFEIRPAGRGAPRIDPKPILDGWKLLEATAIYRAANRNPFFGPDAKVPTIGQILLMSKDRLSRTVLADPHIDIYPCGREDIARGAIDRRVLATLEFLAVSGLRPTVSALKCGHSFFTSSGRVSQHSSGNAADISRINGVPILGHQGPGSIAALSVQRLLTLQGLMEPDQVITLMRFAGAPNTLALPDHADHIHIGWRPTRGTDRRLIRRLNAVLEPREWVHLSDRLLAIRNPRVTQSR